MKNFFGSIILLNGILSIVVLFILIILNIFDGCNNTKEKETSVDKSYYDNDTYNIPDEEHIEYPKQGRYIKYFGADGRIVHYKSKAEYSRSGYYIGDKIVSDSIAYDYYITGEKKSEGYLISEFPPRYNGTMRSFHKNGQLECERYYKDGKSFGDYIVYYENGNPKRETHYTDDPNIVDEIYYNENGSISQKWRLDKMKTHSGTTYEYYDNGHPQRIKDFYRGNLSRESTFYPNGKIKTKGEYTNGKPSGIWYYYNEDGTYTTKDFDPKPRVTYYYSNDDPYDEGYEAGEEQGYEDGKNGHGYEYGYDDSSDYYGEYEEQYEDGYSDGYEEGYRKGQDEYEENEY
jgi:antitoxin component YwqK of YwqJK toxin-antitoxin module